MNYILSPDKEIRSFDGVLANDSEAEEGSHGVQGKLVLIGGLVNCRLYRLTKPVKFKSMFPEHVYFLFVCIQSPYHFIFPDFTDRTLTLFVFYSDQKKKEKKDRDYNQIFNVKVQLFVSFLSQNYENL